MGGSLSRRRSTIPLDTLGLECRSDTPQRHGRRERVRLGRGMILGVICALMPLAVIRWTRVPGEP